MYPFYIANYNVISLLNSPVGRIFETLALLLFANWWLKEQRNSLKTPWKCTSKLLENSLKMYLKTPEKKVCHELWEPWLYLWLYQ